jgi:maltose alpha-D-glucosyltransferase/alpha-amylase
VWSDSDKKYAGTRVIFTDTESSNWSWDPVAQSYYWHRFFSHQPDLNFDNPHVLKAIMKVMHFWLDMGVDGLRLDAIPYLCEREGTNNENLPETHAVLKRMRAELDRRHRAKMFLAEANQWPEDVRPYFGDGDECHVAFHFPLMPRIYMAVAMEDRHPIVEIMEQTPEIPESCQWSIFLRNHDELTLEMVTDRERDYMYQIYASDKRMRINVGIRRRLAPLVENDVERIKLLDNLLMSMPGSPIIYYGDEIGMGDNIFLGDRNGVRTPMQWSPDRNAGFSRADPQRLYLPPIMDPVYGYEAVNVESQLRDPSSLLNWMRRLLAVRKAHKAFGRGTLKFLKPGNRKILVYLREYQNESLLCVSNLSRAAQPVELDLSAYKGRVPVEMMGRMSFPPIGELPYLLTLPGFGFYWFHLTADARVPRWHEERLPALELSVLVLFAGWDTIFPEQIAQSDPARKPLAEKLRTTLEREVWPKFAATQRWYAAKGQAIERVALREPGLWKVGDDTWMLSIIEVHGPASGMQCYFMPMALVWEGVDEERIRSLLHRAMARVRRGPRTGILCDAFADENFCRNLVRAMGENLEVASAGGQLRFRATGAFRALAGEDARSMTVRALGLEQSNTSVILGEKLVLKAYRRVQQGVNPELEIGQFLTDVAAFRNIAQVAGYIEYLPRDGEVMNLAILQSFVANQGDAWAYTRGYLERLLEEHRTELVETRAIQLEAAEAAYFTFVHQLGLRTGELHRALASHTGNPTFDPEPVSPNDLKEWTERVRADTEQTLVQLERQVAELPQTAREEAETLLSQRAAFAGYFDRLALTGLKTFKTRYHGDYHLGQVLVVENDIVIIDFEGEPARPLAERRQKHSPLRDVAGMLRSFNYAAYTALFGVTRDRPEDIAMLELHARTWEAKARQGFLDAYAQGTDGSDLYADDPARIARLRDLFVLEKALYELRYELDNRPDWARIPLKGILALINPPEDPLAQTDTEARK